MENLKVNYLIAASSHRCARTDASGHCDASYPIYPGDILRKHFEQLAETDLSLLTQVTVAQHLPLIRDTKRFSEQYWSGIDDIIKYISCPVEFLPLAGGAFSYGLWTQACQKYGRNFDYYILIEDDYYPAHKDFVRILLDEHKAKLPNGGYLSSFITDHAAISNGIVDSVSFVAAISQYGVHIMDYLNQAAQRNFSFMFKGKIDDYADHYRSLFNVDCIECTHDSTLNHTVDIFNPVQYLVRQQADQTRKCVTGKCV